MGKFLLLMRFLRNTRQIKNYGIWLRYQSRTGYHNMYKEYRDTILNGEQMYIELASRHRMRFPCIQIIKTATIPAKLCKRESTKQLHDSKIKSPLVYKKVRPPNQEAKDNIQGLSPQPLHVGSTGHVYGARASKFSLLGMLGLDLSYGEQVNT